jgi:hypothetical protein
VKDVKEVYKRVVQKLPSIIDGNKKEDIVKEEVEGRLLLKDNLKIGRPTPFPPFSNVI